MIGRLLPLALLGASPCVAVPETPAADPAAAPFPVFAFFAGRSEGRATLKIAFRRPETVRVESLGAVEEGVLVLRQRISEGDKAPRERVWRISEVSVGHYAGTLSDAEGPIRAEATPGRLHLAFTMKGGLATEQWLTLARDGRSADNILVARRLGLAVAVLRERIVKLGEAPAGG
jgi:hypothetical protein